MENNELIKYDFGLITRATNAISITNKILALTELPLIPYRKNDKWGFCDKNRKKVIECIYDDAEPFSNSLAIVKLNEDYYFINTKGKVAFDKSFGYLKPFFDGFAVVTKYNGPKIVMYSRSGLIDKDGKEIIPLIYKQVSNSGFSNGLTLVQTENEKWGYVTKSGEEIFLQEFGEVSSFKNDFAKVSSYFNPRLIGGQKILYGFINKDFDIKIDLKYESLKEYSDGLIAAKINGKWGFIDINDNVVIQFQYNNAWSFTEELAGVSKDGKWGFINTSNQLIIPFDFSSVYPFNEGLAVVCNNSKWGYIDKSGKIVIPLIYGSANGFSNGLAQVSLNGKKGYIDNNGNQYWEN